MENIDLRGESSVNGEWMAYIGGFVNLFSLNLSDCPRINNSTLWPITGIYLSYSDFAMEAYDDDDEKCRFGCFFFFQD